MHPSAWWHSKSKSMGHSHRLCDILPTAQLWHTLRPLSKVSTRHCMCSHLIQVADNNITHQSSFYNPLNLGDYPPSTSSDLASRSREATLSRAKETVRFAILSPPIASSHSYLFRIERASEFWGKTNKIKRKVIWRCPRDTKYTRRQKINFAFLNNHWRATLSLILSGKLFHILIIF